MDKFMRYLFVVHLAREKYTVRGALPISFGGIPSKYSKVEKWAVARYLSK